MIQEIEKSSIKSRHIVIDTETIGLGPKAALTQVALASLDWTGESVVKKLSWGVDVNLNEQFMSSRSTSFMEMIDVETLEWRLCQPQSGKRSPKMASEWWPIFVDILNNLIHNVDKFPVFVWLRGWQFDLPKLHHYGELMGDEYPLLIGTNDRRLRCIRTLEMFLPEDARGIKTHTAIEDAIADLNLVEFALRKAGTIISKVSDDTAR